MDGAIVGEIYKVCRHVPKLKALRNFDEFSSWLLDLPAAVAQPRPARSLYDDGPPGAVR